jgi:hypothetical protein
MSRTWIIPAMVIALALAGGGVVSATEPDEGQRIDDPVGDATGTAPDIVACTISEPDGPLVSIDVEFASEPPISTDMETYTDVIFIDLAVDPEGDMETLEEARDETDFIIGTHAVTLPEALERGGHMYPTAEGSELYWNVVDVAVEGPTITFSVDRKLLGDPDVISWHVLATVERGEDAEVSEESGDECPNDSRGTYELTKWWG